MQRFEAPADSACRVEIEPDAFPGDDRFFVPMRIRDRKQILLVTPPAEGETQERGLDFGHRGADLLAYALNPGEALGQGGTAINVKRVTPALLGRVSLPIYSVIILYGVTDLPEQSAALGPGAAVEDQELVAQLGLVAADRRVEPSGDVDGIGLDPVIGDTSVAPVHDHDVERVVLPVGLEPDVPGVLDDPLLLGPSDRDLVVGRLVAAEPPEGSQNA